MAPSSIGVDGLSFDTPKLTTSVLKGVQKLVMAETRCGAVGSLRKTIVTYPRLGSSAGTRGKRVPGANMTKFTYTSAPATRPCP